MPEEKSLGRVLPRNPLGMIALFVFLIESVATVSLRIVADAKAASLLLALVLFIIAFPTVIAMLFFIILWKRREVLYSPTDFSDPKSFEHILYNVQQNIARIEAKQDAAQIDIDTAVDDLYRAIDRLVELDDIATAVNLGRSFFNKGEFEKSSQVFDYLLKKVPASHELHFKVLANIGYALIGQKKYAEAIEHLHEVETRKKGLNFRPWHALALAYANFMLGNRTAYRAYLRKAKRDPVYEELDMKFFRQLYPEISEELEGGDSG